MGIFRHYLLSEYIALIWPVFKMWRLMLTICGKKSLDKRGSVIGTAEFASWQNVKLLL